MSRQKSYSYIPFLSFWLIPVSEKERVWPREVLPGPLWPSEKDERLGAAGATELFCRYWSLVSSCSLLWDEPRESLRLRWPRLPIARYSGPSSESPSQESSGWAKEGEGDSVRNVQGMDPDPGGGVMSRPLSSGLDTNTQGTPKLLSGEVVSATHQDKKRIVIFLLEKWTCIWNTTTNNNNKVNII